MLPMGHDHANMADQTEGPFLERVKKRGWCARPLGARRRGGGTRTSRTNSRATRASRETGAHAWGRGSAGEPEHPSHPWTGGNGTDGAEHAVVVIAVVRAFPLPENHELVQPGALGGHRAAGCRLRSGCRGRTDGRRHLAGPARAWAGTHCRGPTVRTARSQHHRRVLVVLPVVEAAVTGMLAEDIAGEEDDRHDEHGSGGNGYPRRGFEHLGGLVRRWCWGFRCFTHVSHDALANSNATMRPLCSSCERAGWVSARDTTMAASRCQSTRATGLTRA